MSFKKTMIIFLLLMGVGAFLRFSLIRNNDSKESQESLVINEEPSSLDIVKPFFEIIASPANSAETINPQVNSYAFFDVSNQASRNGIQPEERHLEQNRYPDQQTQYRNSYHQYSTGGYQHNYPKYFEGAYQNNYYGPNYNPYTPYYNYNPYATYNPYTPYYSSSQSENYDTYGSTESSRASNKPYLRLETGAVFGNYIGLKENYGEIGIFASPGFYHNWYPFLDLHGYHFKSGLWAASAGAGLRYWDDCNDRIWGLNVFYDYRDTCIKDRRGCDCKCDFNERHWNSFNRIGVGFESLGCIDFRVNGYFPVGSNSHSGRPIVFDDFDGDFWAQVKRKEFVYYGFDAEIGTRIGLFCDWWVYGAGGTYFYSHRDLDEFWGGQARLEINWRDMFSLQARYSYDDNFRSQVQGRVLISFPLDYFTCCGSTCFELCQTFWNQSVQRNPIPFVRNKCCWKWNW